MNKLIENAAKKTFGAMKKINVKLKTKEIFSDNSIFDFSTDMSNKIKPKRKISDNIESWSNDDFILYIKSKFKYSLISVCIADKEMLKRTRDKIRKGLVSLDFDKNEINDNNVLKIYIDWCFDSFGEQLGTLNRPFSSKELLDKVSVYFETGSWIALKNSQKAYTAQTPQAKAKTPPSEIYKAGGLNKLIYEIGIVDSYYFLTSDIKKSPKDSLRELKAILKKSHDAVFNYVIEKTLRNKPYDKIKEFDLEKMIRPIFEKRKINIFDSIDFNKIFNKENE
jgi:hypothetical protein